MRRARRWSTVLMASFLKEAPRSCLSSSCKWNGLHQGVDCTVSQSLTTAYVRLCVAQCQRTNMATWSVDLQRP